MGTTPALPDPHGRLAGLVRALDELRAEPTLTQLADALVAAKLRLDDVAAYVTPTPIAYHRASVVRRDHYELLVLTWLPGQGSAPHDHAGSVSAAQADDDGVRLYVRERGADRLVELRAGVVINCTGPAASNSAESNPAIGSLLVHGWVRPDVLSLGLETTADGEVVDASGEAAADLFVVGTLRKFAVWESTAVPELRVQAAQVGARVVAGLRREG